MGGRTSSKTKQNSISQVNLDPNLVNSAYSGLTHLNTQYGQRMGTYSPDQFVPMNPNRQEAYNRYNQFADWTSQVPQQVLDEYQKTIGGEYLNPDSNPWLRTVAERSAQIAASPVHSGFARSGRFGTGSYANALTDTTGGTAANIYGSAYESERNRMSQASGMAPQMYQLSLAEQLRQAQTKEQVGLAYEDEDRRRKAEQLRQYNDPWIDTLTYQGALAGNVLAQQKSVTTKGTSSVYEPFDWGGFVGGLLSPSIPGGK